MTNLEFVRNTLNKQGIKTTNGENNSLHLSDYYYVQVFSDQLALWECDNVRRMNNIVGMFTSVTGLILFIRLIIGEKNLHSNFNSVNLN